MKRLISIAVFALSALAVIGPATAEEGERSWTDVAEFGLVLTTGNTENTNISFANKFTYGWENAELIIDALALRTENGTAIFTVPAPGATASRSFVDQLTAESYLLAGKYRRDINERLFWYVGGGWFKDEPTGISERLNAGGGVGYRFFENDAHALIGEFGVDYTDETPITGPSDSWAGARAFLGYLRNISETSLYTSELEVLENLDDTDDLRANWINAITASLTSKLALKVSHTIKYDKQPVMLLVTDPLTTNTGAFEFDDVDTLLTASLVVNF